MRKLFIYIILLFILLPLIQCSSDDDTTNVEEEDYLIRQWIYDKDNGYIYLKFRSDDTFEMKALSIIPYNYIEIDGEYIKKSDTIKFEYSNNTSEIMEYDLYEDELTLEDMEFEPFKSSTWKEPTIIDFIKLRENEKFRAYFEEDGKKYVVKANNFTNSSNKYSIGTTDGNIWLYLSFPSVPPFPELDSHSCLDYKDANNIWSIDYKNVLFYSTLYSAMECPSSICICNISINNIDDAIVYGGFDVDLLTSAGSGTKIRNGVFYLNLVQ